jgi:hypothetical protein
MNDSWYAVKQTDPRAVALYLRHYSARNGNRRSGITGPGETLTLMTSDGLALWDTVSAERDGARYKAGACLKRWRDFGKSKTGGMVTLGTLIMLAKRGGYSEGVTFESEIDWGDVEVIASPPEAPPLP